MIEEELQIAKFDLAMRAIALEELKARLVKEMILTRTRTEMLEEFGPDYEQYL